MARRSGGKLRGGEGGWCNNVWGVYLVVEKKMRGLAKYWLRRELIDSRGEMKSRVLFC